MAKLEKPKIQKMYNIRNILLVFALTIAFIVRIYWLDKIPPGISGDELAYISTAQSILQNRTKLLGTWNPFTIFSFHYPQGQMQAELPYFLHIPALFIFKNPLFAARITNVIFSVISIYLIYEITNFFFNPLLGIIAAYMTAINPWTIFMARSAYETPSTVFFFLLLLFIILKGKNRKILYAIPVGFLAFYSYIGTKIILIPFAFISMLYTLWGKNKDTFKHQTPIYIIVISSFLVLSAFFYISIHTNQDGSRLNEFFLPTNETVINLVNNWRLTSIDNPFGTFIINKYTLYFRLIINKFFNIFSTSYLFLSGDEIFALYRHGLFYYLDFIFMLLGIAYIYKSNKKTLFLLFGLILIAITPQIIHTKYDNFSQHMTLVFPFFIIFIAAGIGLVIENIKTKKYQLLSAGIIAFLYLVSLGNFIEIYAYHFPIMNYGEFDFRLLSTYINKSLKKERHIIVYSAHKRDFMNNYLFYNNLYSNSTLTSSVLNQDKIIIDNLTVTSCDDKIIPDESSDIIIIDALCNQPISSKRRIRIPQLSDSGRKDVIYNDSLCNNIQLNNFLSRLHVNDFNLMNLTDNKFCSTFLVND